MRKFFLGISLLLIFNLNLNAQCDFNANVKLILGNGEVTAIQKLILQIKDCPNLQDSLGYCYHKLGVIHYHSGRYEQAIQANTKALNTRTALQPKSPFTVARSCHNLGASYNKKGDFQNAEQYILRAAQLYNQLDTPRVISSYRELAKLYYRKGDYTQSTQSLKIAIQKSKKFKDDYLLAECFIDMSRLRLAQKQYEEAIHHIQEAKSKFKDIADLDGEARCNINLAQAYFELKNYAEASKYYQQAIVLLRQLKNDKDLATTLSNLSVVHLKQDNFRQALQYAKEGLSVALKTKQPKEISQSYNNLGEIYLAQKKFQQALSYFQKDANALIPDFDDSNFERLASKKQLDLVANKIDLLGGLKDKARAWKIYYQNTQKEDHLQQALKVFEQADYLVDQIRKEQINETSKLFWRENVVDMYEQAIQVCYILKDTKRAFYFFEKSKSILLLEGLLHAQALDIIPDSIAQKESQLRQQLLYAKEDLIYVTDAEREKTLEQIISLQEKLNRFSYEISHSYPQYFNIKYQSEVVSLDLFKKSLAEKSIFLHFFNGQENSYLLCIDQVQEKFIKLGNTSEINALLYPFLNFFQHASEIEQAPDAYAKIAFEVYQKLLNAIDLSNKSELIIVPDGLLSFLPFEALVNQSSQASLANLPYLIRKHKIRYSYSGTILSKQVAGQKNSKTKFLALAPFASSTSQENYSNLKYAQDELASIENEITGDFLKNEMASKVNFFQQAPTASIIHLSTHALANADSLQPRIVFADTLLFLSELYGLQLNADLIVLSACQTNIGKIQSGEGVMSMARGFTYAGARSQISSLWNVNAATTGQIFSDFYTALIQGSPSAQAFHQAKIKHLDNINIRPSQKSPYYWAGFVYIGPDRIIPIEIARAVSTKSLAWIGLSLLAIGLLLAYFLKN